MSKKELTLSEAISYYRSAVDAYGYASEITRKHINNGRSIRGFGAFVVLDLQQRKIEKKAKVISALKVSLIFASGFLSGGIVLWIHSILSS